MPEPKDKKEVKANLSMLSVLLVEDNSFMRMVFMSVLRTMGIENIVTANHGGEAIKAIEEKAKIVPIGTAPFDLIFLDLLMPEVNGFMTYDRKVIKMPVEKLKAINEKLYNIAASR